MELRAGACPNWPAAAPCVASRRCQRCLGSQAGRWRLAAAPSTSPTTNSQTGPPLQPGGPLPTVVLPAGVQLLDPGLPGPQLQANGPAARSTRSQPYGPAAAATPPNATPAAGLKGTSPSGPQQLALSRPAPAGRSLDGSQQAPFAGRPSSLASHDPHRVPASHDDAPGSQAGPGPSSLRAAVEAASGLRPGGMARRGQRPVAQAPPTSSLDGVLQLDVPLPLSHLSRGPKSRRRVPGAPAVGAGRGGRAGSGEGSASRSLPGRTGPFAVQPPATAAASLALRPLAAGEGAGPGLAAAPGPALDGASAGLPAPPLPSSAAVGAAASSSEGPAIGTGSVPGVTASVPGMAPGQLEYVELLVRAMVRGEQGASRAWLPTWQPPDLPAAAGTAAVDAVGAAAPAEVPAGGGAAQGEAARRLLAPLTPLRRGTGARFRLGRGREERVGLGDPGTHGLGRVGCRCVAERMQQTALAHAATGA
jgi:hypothetical protein